MKTYNFKAQFAPMVESGQKLCTIRAKGKRQPPVPGEPLRFYTGQRTKQCRKLGDRICSTVSEITIVSGHVMLDRILLDGEQVETLARADGHASKEMFLSFFCPQGKPFNGHLIHWLPQ